MGDKAIIDSQNKYKKEIKGLLIKYHTCDKKDKKKVYEVIFKRKDTKLLTAFISLLNDEIDNFSFEEDTNEGTYLFSLLRLLPDTININNHMLRYQIILNLNEFSNEIDRKLHMNEDNKNKRYKILERLQTKIFDRSLKISNDELDGLLIDNDSCKDDFIVYLIFKVKNIDYIKRAIKDYPYIVNIIDKDEVPLINKVLKAYMRAIKKYVSDTNLGPLDDLIYYKEVLDLLIHSEKISLNLEDKKKLIHKLTDQLKNTTHETPRQKEKHTFFANKIIMMLLGIEKDKESLDSLNYEYEVHDKFKESHEEEAYIISKKYDDLKAKTNKRRIYTFDGEGAYEIDDALSIEKKDGRFYLGVHIANPLAYIPTDSILYDEARKRTRSLYIGDKCIPMYPTVLSTDIMSLNEGKVRYATSHYFEIDALSGELLDYKIKVEPIVVTKNLTYDKFNEDILHGNDDEDYMEVLYNLCEVAPILGRVYNEELLYQQLHSDNSRTLATSVVEKAMIYTNHNIAKKFAEQGLPFINRCHKIDEKQLKRIDQIKQKIFLQSDTIHYIGDNKNVIRNLELIKSMFPRAYYTTSNEGHMGLGIDYYSHVTSPLRRYADNVAIECINKFILSDYTADDIKAYEEYIQQVAESINTKRRTLDNYEIERGKRLYNNLHI